jgi:hydroxymethylbilane synthase
MVRRGDGAVRKTSAVRTLVIGTRGSRLALWQARHVASLLQDVDPALKCEIREINTAGDRMPDQDIPDIGGKGLFTLELDEAIRDGTVDLAVHSLKDLPVDQLDGITVGAVCERASPYDVFVSREHPTVAACPAGARIGTSSLRRRAQLTAYRSDLEAVPLRGNVDTRVQKAMDGMYDGIIVAAAGILRLGLQQHIREYLSPEWMMPAPGQGALAVQCRADDERALRLLGNIDHASSRAATGAERAFLHALGGGCSAPVAALAEVTGEAAATLNLAGVVLAADGSRMVRGELTRSAGAPDDLGRRLARELERRGAGDLL